MIHIRIKYILSTANASQIHTIRIANGMFLPSISPSLQPRCMRPTVHEELIMVFLYYYTVLYYINYHIIKLYFIILLYYNVLYYYIVLYCTIILHFIILYSWNNLLDWFITFARWGHFSNGKMRWKTDRERFSTFFSFEKWHPQEKGMDTSSPAGLRLKPQ